jgi:putative addiction module component (TIGR02574 family)
MERAELLEHLLSSFDRESSVTADIETAWLSEARERMVAYQHGEISARPADEVFFEINRKFAV